MARIPEPSTRWLREIIDNEYPGFVNGSEVDIDGLVEAVYQRAVEDVVMWQDLTDRAAGAALRVKVNQFLNAREHKDWQRLEAELDGQDSLPLPEWDEICGDHFTYLDADGKRRRVVTAEASLEEVRAGISQRQRELETDRQYLLWLQAIERHLAASRTASRVRDLYRAA